MWANLDEGNYLCSIETGNILDNFHSSHLHDKFQCNSLPDHSINTRPTIPTEVFPEKQTISNFNLLHEKFGSTTLDSGQTMKQRRPQLHYANQTESIKSQPVKRKSSQTTREREIVREYWDETSQKVVREQIERGKRIKLQEEREETARIERALNQQRYNVPLLAKYHQPQAFEHELVLETDPITNEIVIEVSIFLVIHMKPHQMEGLKFLWNQVFESTSRIADGIKQYTQEDTGGSGAILAHCMGLGKTFTIVALIHTLFRYPKLTRIHRVLILCPVNTVINWKNEFNSWLNGLEPNIDLYTFTDEINTPEQRENFLKKWYENGGVLIMSYTMYRIMTFADDDKPEDLMEKLRKEAKKKKEKILSNFELSSIIKYRKYLRNPGPDLTVCDEGHIIKNLKSEISCTLNKIRTLRRIILTGTPIQNNLKEYYSMIHFCKPNYLGTQAEFNCNYRTAIEDGQNRDSEKNAVLLMRRRVYKLYQHLSPIVHRKNLDILRSYLPPKFEYAIKIKCHPIQQALYEKYINQNVPLCFWKQYIAKLFADYQYLMKVWTHPWLLQPYFIQHYIQSDSDEVYYGNNADDLNIQSPETTSEPLSNENISNSSEQKALAVIKNAWWSDIFDVNSSKFNFEISGKLIVLKEIIDKCELIGDKILVFSRSLLLLDYIEQCFAYWSERSSTSKWEKGIDYFRIDGQTPMRNRAKYIELFNREHNHQSRLFLISTMAGGLGINLYAANRVIIMDTSWNPANDTQSIFRSYRMGQMKPTYVYRLIVKGTMEEKIYKRQIVKQALLHRVVDAHQLDRHFTFDELRHLYEYNFAAPIDPMDNSDPTLIEDKLLRDLFYKHKDLMVAYCEHDSFLIHREEQSLTTEEKNRAVEEDINEARKEVYHTDQFDISMDKPVIDTMEHSKDFYIDILDDKILKSIDMTSYQLEKQ